MAKVTAEDERLAFFADFGDTVAVVLTENRSVEEWLHEPGALPQESKERIGRIALAIAKAKERQRERDVPFCPKHGDTMKSDALPSDEHFTCTVLGCYWKCRVIRRRKDRGR